MDIKKIGTILYMAVMVFYGVYTMVLSIQAYTKFADTTQTYINITNNLGSSFITDVQVSTTSCPSGYTTIFDWNWQGSNAGCDCTTSTYTSTHKGVYAGACNSTETSKNCKNLAAQAPVQFSAIEGATNQKQFVCTKRGSERFSNIAAQQTGTCSSTQKTCGNTSKKESVICVGANDPCPVYGLKMSATIDAVTYPSPDWTMSTLASGQYLYVNTKGSSATALPISELRFTQSGVCKLENTEKKLPSGATDYSLVKTTRNSCSETDDTFLLTNFKVAENKYYSLNVPSAQWTQMQAWPNYAVTTSIEPFLSYQRPFINWNIASRNQLKDIVDSASSIQNLKSAQLVAMIINIIVCICVSIILQISQVYNLCGKDVPCIDGSGDSEQQRIVKIKKILTYGSKLLQAPFLLWAFIVSAQKKGILRLAADSQPSDARFNSELSLFANQLESDVYKKNLTALIVLLCTVLLDIILWLKGKYCAKKIESNQVEPANNNGNKNSNDEEQYIKQQNQSGMPTSNNQSYNNQTPYQQQEMQQYPQNPQYQPQFQQPVYVQPVLVQQPIQPVVVVQPLQPTIVYQQY